MLSFAQLPSHLSCILVFGFCGGIWGAVLGENMQEITKITEKSTTRSKIF